MAQDAADGVSYYLAVGRNHDEDLARIRHWNNVKIGHEENTTWAKELDYAQINSVEVRSLPSKTIYYEKESKLFLLQSLLPDRIVPSLLWTPIGRAIQVKLPSFNHNYFGLNERIEVRMIRHDYEAKAVAMVTDLEILRSYIESAPSIRLEQMRWTILERSQAFLLGKPLLPLPGNTFWQRKDMLIPAGYDFELSILADVIQRCVSPGRDHYILWTNDATYCAVPKVDLQPLSRSSFRLSYQYLQKNNQQ